MREGVLQVKIRPDNSVALVTVLLLTFIGALSNDYYNILTEKEKTMKAGRVMLSTFAGAIIMIGLSNYIMRAIDEEAFFFVCYIAGITGFKIFSRLKRIDLVNIFNIFGKVMKLLKKIELDDDDGEDKDP